MRVGQAIVLIITILVDVFMSFCDPDRLGLRFYFKIVNVEVFLGLPLLR